MKHERYETEIAKLKNEGVNNTDNEMNNNAHNLFYPMCMQYSFCSIFTYLLRLQNYQYFSSADNWLPATAYDLVVVKHER